MTRYTVVWRDEALNELADIWVQSSDRDAVTRSVRSLDMLLSADPNLKGDVLLKGLRQLLEPPLRILYEVQVEDRLARVLAVGLI